MQNNSRKVFETLVSRTKIYLAIILILLLIISIETQIMIIQSITLYLLVIE